ncbi:hypothetical protein R6Q59_002785 [Mikania micrantha]|uniref:Ninja-family protein n=1 Tax=Mikania micrantha TaxID=192012 RepID=A0A5N6NPH1_9ASTR|nr:hypothetical protein E3N88_19797 [Mikania micrantha]
MGERTNNEMGNLSLEVKNKFSRDLLQRFTGSGDPAGSDPEEEVELNLGLSLGGRFGVDKSKLVRSSSIAAILPVVQDDDVLAVGKGKTGRDGSYSGLVRTASLPVETEDEWRKRKELQSLRRLAAKRRRSEKQKNLTSLGSSVGPALGSGKWDYAGPATSDGSGGGVLTPPSLPGSVESQASTISEFETRHLQGSSTEGEASPASVQSSQDRTNQDGTSSSRSKGMEPTARQSRPRPKPKTENPPNNKGKEIRSSTIDMPCVFTQGDGPGGRRIEGILYKYGKGEEVKIMCVCHGSFLTPAEFVKHAGGTDVDNPLKHIVVNPNSSSYL